MTAPKRVLLRIAGVFSDHAGYPNVMHRLSDLYAAPEFDIDEVTAPWPGRGPAHVGGGAVSMLAFSLVLCWRQMSVMLRWMTRPRAQAIYLPYPALISAWWLSWLPKRTKPPIIIDAFISWYDTVVKDRKLLAPDSFLARVLWLVEARAYRAASLILVDTHQNAALLAENFGLPTQRVQALRLAIDESMFAPTPYIANASTVKVLFVGTFVPLQGVEFIAAAIRELCAKPSLQFEIIGDGQMSSTFEQALGENALKNITWSREWQSSAAIFDAINTADICLGIFGAGDKADRVWPFKNYLYMRVGRALITGDTTEANHLDSLLPSPCFITVPRADAKALANAILALSLDSHLRGTLAANAAKGFDATLKREVTTTWLRQAICELAQAPISTR
jgi:glycosyltransferase involved in cell wall biosynthesis